MWTPPDDPNPFDILHTARHDIDKGSHARALDKFLWFHHNALRLNRGLVGVRLSFALSDWMRLAVAYPPAMAAFRRTRDETESAFRGEPSNFELFHDLAALNGHLGDGVRTADLFLDVARDDPATAARLYRVAEPFLIAVGRYDACGPFLDPPQRMWIAAESYGVLKGMEEADEPSANRVPKLARVMYMHAVATLVALLALTQRAEEANRTRDEGLAVLDDEEFRGLLNEALTGHLPPPLHSVNTG